MTRLIDADALKELMIEVLEHIKENPKMDGQERHIIAGIHMLGEMIDDAPTVDADKALRKAARKLAYIHTQIDLYDDRPELHEEAYWLEYLIDEDWKDGQID